MAENRNAQQVREITDKLEQGSRSCLNLTGSKSI